MRPEWDIIRYRDDSSHKNTYFSSESLCRVIIMKENLFQEYRMI